jgi:hypothetical protein
VACRRPSLCTLNEAGFFFFLLRSSNSAALGKTSDCRTTERTAMTEYSKADMFKPLTSTVGGAPLSDNFGDNAPSLGAQTFRSNEAALSRSATAENKREPFVYCIAMIRNEADIIATFLNQTLVLFDKTFIVDIQSSDGTKEIVDASARNGNGRIIAFNCFTQERY